MGIRGRYSIDKIRRKMEISKLHSVMLGGFFLFSLLVLFPVTECSGKGCDPNCKDIKGVVPMIESIARTAGLDPYNTHCSDFRPLPSWKLEMVCGAPNYAKRYCKVSCRTCTPCITTPIPPTTPTPTPSVDERMKTMEKKLEKIADIFQKKFNI